MHRENELAALDKEVALLDDSYYRVYDDTDYAVWHSRMTELIVRYGFYTNYRPTFIETTKQTAPNRIPHSGSELERCGRGSPFKYIASSETHRHYGNICSVFIFRPALSSIH